MDERVHLQSTLYAEQFKRNRSVQVHFVSLLLFFCFFFLIPPIGCAFATVQYNQLTCVSMHPLQTVQYV